MDERGVNVRFVQNERNAVGLEPWSRMSRRCEEIIPRQRATPERTGSTAERILKNRNARLPAAKPLLIADFLGHVVMDTAILETVASVMR